MAGSLSSALVRGLLLLVCAIVLVDTMLYAALVPLLPPYADEYGLSKTGAGLLVAAYAIGVLVTALPSGVAAARFAAKAATLAGLWVIAASSVGFALAGDTWTLGLARFVQGAGSALSWSGGLAWLISATARERRGEMLGTALGAAIFGALLGPVLGGAAALVGTRPAFVGVAALVVLLAIAGVRIGGVPAEPISANAFGQAFANGAFLTGLWLIVLFSVLFGVLSVLVPLDLAALGWSGVAVGAVYLAGAGAEAVTSPFIGRLTDRRGRIGPLRVALAASVAVSLALALADGAALVAALAILAALAYGGLVTPGIALLSDGAERVGLSLGLAFGLMNAAWAAGAAAGPAAGGAAADAVGDPVTYVVGGAFCLVTLLALDAPSSPWHSRFVSARVALARRMSSR